MISLASWAPFRILSREHQPHSLAVAFQPLLCLVVFVEILQRQAICSDLFGHLVGADEKRKTKNRMKML
jgi:hypothetical protein